MTSISKKCVVCVELNKFVKNCDVDLKLFNDLSNIFHHLNVQITAFVSTAFTTAFTIIFTTVFVSTAFTIALTIVFVSIVFIIDFITIVITIVITSFIIFAYVLNEFIEKHQFTFRRKKDSERLKRKKIMTSKIIIISFFQT